MWKSYFRWKNKSLKKQAVTFYIGDEGGVESDDNLHENPSKNDKNVIIFDVFGYHFCTGGLLVEKLDDAPVWVSDSSGSRILYGWTFWRHPFSLFGIVNTTSEGLFANGWIGETWFSSFS